MKLTEKFIKIRNNPPKQWATYDEGFCDIVKVYEDCGFRVRLLNAGGTWKSEMFNDKYKAKEYAIRNGGDAIIEEFAGIYATYIAGERYVYEHGKWEPVGKEPIYKTATLEFITEEIDYIPASSRLEAQRQLY